MATAEEIRNSLESLHKVLVDLDDFNQSQISQAVEKAEMKGLPDPVEAAQRAIEFLFEDQEKRKEEEESKRAIAALSKTVSTRKGKGKGKDKVDWDQSAPSHEVSGLLGNGGQGPRSSHPRGSHNFPQPDLPPQPPQQPPSLQEPPNKRPQAAKRDRASLDEESTTLQAIDLFDSLSRPAQLALLEQLSERVGSSSSGGGSRAGGDGGGGGGGAGAEEKRCDGDGYYTKAEFLHYYGEERGEKEWQQALSSPAVPPAVAPAALPPPHPPVLCPDSVHATGMEHPPCQSAAPG